MNGVVRSALALALLASTVLACSGGEPPRAPAAAVSTVPGDGHGGRGASPAPSPSPSASPSPPAVTLKDASRALDTFLETDEVLRAAHADRWAYQLTQDGQRPITIAEIRTQGGRRPASYRWDHRTVLVPRQSGAAQWFAATAERHGGPGGARTGVFTFVRQGQDGPWRNSFTSLLNPGEKPPAVELDVEGYAIALGSRDSSVAISPNLMGPLHATVAEEGPKGYASGLIAPGPQTTGFYDEISRTKVKAKADDCMAYESIFASAPNYPIFALRTRDGGALTMYTLIRTSSWITSAQGPGQGQGVKCSEGRPVAVPAAARWLLSPTKDLMIHQKRQIVETQQYVSAVPPKASTAPVHVVGYQGVVTGGFNR
ncbi:hypothetical protein [Microbispora triticiradicis]|uniref:DUF8094 domain-containing protein n=2 Tax=Microbispora TaxID=2005 RepID=A0ABY3LVD7_9ACTN|nr:MULTISPECIES: hypothetical protein [Microbispora]TLP61993.1 hypothetical protein FED44_08355 [Microbispora fusca]TYB56085.1 hypothetical protein FXF59_21000 [Microbispora tritici]